MDYSYDPQTGNLTQVKEDGQTVKTFGYTLGRKTAYNNAPVTHDYYGNVTGYLNRALTWNSRNLLAEYGASGVSNTYEYNGQGVRFKKVSGGVTTNYYLDGDKVLGEDRSVGGVVTKFRYHYDIEGVTGFTAGEYKFTFARDGLGNVSKVYYNGLLLGEYIYDAWGSCKIINLSSGSFGGTAAQQILELNPFRWKSYYLDTETGLYYISGRYYCPGLMQYLDADDMESLLQNAFILNALDRSGLTVDNVIDFLANLDNFFTSEEFFLDPNYVEPEVKKKKSFWDIFKWVLFAVVLVVSVVLMIIPGTQAFGIGMFMAGLKCALSGFVIGAVIGAITAAINGSCWIEGMITGAIDGFVTGFITGALFFCAGQAIGGIAKVANKAKPKPTTFSLSGKSVLEFDPRIQSFANNVKPEPGFYDVIAHGTKRSVGGHNAKQLARIIRADPMYKGQNVRLLSCNAGAAKNGVAQKLANTLDVKVLAPTDVLRPSTNIPGNFHIDGGGSMKLFFPK